jgi:hypothetical protein
MIKEAEGEAQVRFAALADLRKKFCARDEAFDAVILAPNI